MSLLLLCSVRGCAEASDEAEPTRRASPSTLIAASTSSTSPLLCSYPPRALSLHSSRPIARARLCPRRRGEPACSPPRRLISLRPPAGTLAPAALEPDQHLPTTRPATLTLASTMPAEATPTTLSPEPGTASKTSFPLDVRFPVYSIAFTSDDTVVLAGGGGSSRTGVKNRLVRPALQTPPARAAQLVPSAHLRQLPCAQSMYTVDVKKRQISLVEEHELSKEEDAPMTVAVHPQVRSLARSSPPCTRAQTHSVLVRHAEQISRRRHQLVHGAAREGRQRERARVQLRRQGVRPLLSRSPGSPRSARLRDLRSSPRPQD